MNAILISPHFSCFAYKLSLGGSALLCMQIIWSFLSVHLLLFDAVDSSAFVLLRPFAFFIRAAPSRRPPPLQLD